MTPPSNQSESAMSLGRTSGVGLAMDTLIYEQELNWNESIKVINSQQSSHDDDVLLALNDLEMPDS
jgi:hypothetical protein